MEWCAWNVNMNNGNTNNNNRNNNNYVRAVSEFHETMENTMGNICISYESLYEAYMDCRRHKRGTANAVIFEIDHEANLLLLRDQINSRTYLPGRSIAFIVEKPVKREIFAADFRDRVVHHWIAIRIEPLLENIFIGESYNCRKGKGTLAGINGLADMIQQESANYTRDCWVLKYDLKGFFMSINRQLITDKLCRFLAEKYEGDDLDTLLFLCNRILLNAPENNCIIKGNPAEWEGLAVNKSLFTVPSGYGLPIGNLTSQLVANFLLNDADHFIKDRLGIRLNRYVDDVVMVSRYKQDLLAAMPLIRDYLWETSGTRVHQDKYYLQHYTKGVKFIGAVIKRDRKYLANRTVGGAYNRLHKFNELVANNPDFAKKKAEYFVSCINSYLGLMRHFNEYALRRDYIEAIDKAWFKVVYVDKDYTKLTVKKRFKHRERIKFALRKQRHKALKQKTSDE